jgi:predicted solute-binding protein
MRIALWDEPALDLLTSAIEQSGRFAPTALVRASRTSCRNALVLGEVDIALVPTLTLFREPDLFDGLPAVALSSWDWPTVEILLHRPLSDGIRTVSFDPRFAQETLLAQIVLKEHYAAEPSFKPVETTAAGDLWQAPTDAALVIQHPTADLPGVAGRFDLGREWFELTNYPLVWGVFVAQRGTATSAFVRHLTLYAGLAEQITESWVRERDLEPRLAVFLREYIRYRFDDLAVAGFTALQDYLYFALATDDIAPVSFFEVPASEEDAEDAPLL